MLTPKNNLKQKLSAAMDKLKQSKGISQNAANRKVSKDKGYIVGESYVPFSRNQKKSTSSPGNVQDAMSQSKSPRTIKQKSISQNAANRKVSKDKGYIVGDSYVGFSRSQKKSTSSPGTLNETMKSSKTPKRIR